MNPGNPENPVWRRIRTVAWKESIHIFRDFKSLSIVILMPIVMLLLYGYALNFDIKEIRISLVDSARDSMTREFFNKLTASGYFLDIHKGPVPLEIAEQALQKGETTLVLILPEDFTSKLKKGNSVPVQVLADGTDPNTASIGLAYLQTICAQFTYEVILEHLQRKGMGRTSPPGIRTEPRIWFNQEMRSASFIVPGIIAIIMMLTAALLTSLTVVREKENGTFEQLAASPIKPLELMTGKLLPYIIIGFGDVLLVTLFGGLVFDVTFKGSILLLAVSSLFFIFCALGIGLLASTIAPNQTVAVIATVFITVLPSVLLSGFVFPIQSMPWFIKPFSYLVPGQYYLTLLRTLFLKGDIPIGSIALEGIILLIFGSLLLLAASARMRKKLE